MQTRKNLTNFEELQDNLARRKITSSHNVAKSVIRVFTQIVSQQNILDPDTLYKNMKRIGELLINTDKMNFIVRNTVERCLNVFKEECKKLEITLKSNQNKSVLQSLH